MTKQILIASRTYKTDTELTVVCFLYVNKVCAMVLPIWVEYTGKNCFLMLKTLPSTIKVFMKFTPDIVSLLARRSKVVHPGFFRPGATDLQLDKLRIFPGF